MNPQTKDFNSIIIKLASPERMREWSRGEVTKAETINYRTGRSERNGLFDERIFGPTKDYECYCGKYRRIRYKNIICERCGVEVTRSIVRRERMGHIELASPVSHIWFLRGVPSRIGLLLNLSLSDVEKVVYFAGYMVTEVYEGERNKILKDLESEFKSKQKIAESVKEKEILKKRFTEVRKEIEDLRAGSVLDEVSYHRFSLKYGSVFHAEIGAEALYNLLKKVNLEKLATQLEADFEEASAAEKTKIRKRLALVKSLVEADVCPEWMFLTVIPVMPPQLRPMVALDGGRHATSDVNDLYRRVINRNNRLKKLKEINAPDVILRNEKRILQEAVDSLLDNSMRRSTSQQAAHARKKVLKSLSENLKGKQGLFRQNLLGKRVDYSGRSVIVVGPSLRLDQCGLPKHMALELFRPFVISEILKQELAYNIRGAGRLIEEGLPEVWAILEDVIKDKYVLLNRAPTLHRLGVQAFKPILIEGNAIELHPLVCPAFNADFDGDQMAVHVPLSKEAQGEAREIMAADKNIFKPGTGYPVVISKMLDITLGTYWVTKILPGEKGEGKVFGSPNLAITAHDFGILSLRAKIKVMATETEKYAQLKGGVFETSVGRLLFNSVLPSDYPYINAEVDKSALSEIMDNIIEKYPVERITTILDKIKDFGFKFATKSGITWGMEDLAVPKEKERIVAEARKKEKEIMEQWSGGLLSDVERYRMVIEVWEKAKEEVAKAIPGTLSLNGSVHDMWKSGARGSLGPITQMTGMKGIVMNTVGVPIDFPIVSSYKEGLTPIEYFITTHGSRKGLTDTALQTAKAGYLTRRLVDVAQDVIITEDDCGDKVGRRVSLKENISGIGVSLTKVIGGRIIVKDIVGADGVVIVPKKTLLKRAEIKKITDAGTEEVFIRSPLSCKTVYGLCRNCYGLDMGRHKLIEQGEAVGVIAAQAIGEPGTQLTMRTFHQGGVTGSDITKGLPRVEEVFERRIPKNPAVVSRTDGEVLEIQNKGNEQVLVVLTEEAGAGKKKGERIEYAIPYGRTLVVSAKDKIKKGSLLTDGSANIEELFKYGGKEHAEDYIIHEVERVYDLEGASVARKHFEVIVRQMFSRKKIKSPGDTPFSYGELIENTRLIEENEKTTKAKGEEAKAETLVLGISEVSLTTASFLSAASFQHTTRILIRAATKGARDRLRGLKENVIIGRLIPAGTGFKKKLEK
ncbi:MAG: DNA-directed RNA polymerase subunit beta' [Parcubacteria group bacterium]|nr:DNA-directed RNA polymerase subunit beta' [Parcubacteria group bacterium]